MSTARQSPVSDKIDHIDAARAPILHLRKAIEKFLKTSLLTLAAHKDFKGAGPDDLKASLMKLCKIGASQDSKVKFFNVYKEDKFYDQLHKIKTDFLPDPPPPPDPKETNSLSKEQKKPDILSKEQIEILDLFNDIFNCYIALDRMALTLYPEIPELGNKNKTEGELIFLTQILMNVPKPILDENKDKKISPSSPFSIDIMKTNFSTSATPPKKDETIAKDKTPSQPSSPSKEDSREQTQEFKKAYKSLLTETIEEAEKYLHKNPHPEKSSVLRHLKEVTSAIEKIPSYYDAECIFATPLSAVEARVSANPGTQVKVKPSPESKTVVTYTVKQAPTLGRILAEYIGSQLMQNMHGIEKKHIADSILLIKESPERSNRSLKREEVTYDQMVEILKKVLFVASKWSSDQGSFEAFKILKLNHRIKLAGTLIPGRIKELRRLNTLLNLGLEFFVIPAIYGFDLDAHIGNFMLKINLDRVSDSDKDKALQLLEALKKELSSTVSELSLVVPDFSNLKNILKELIAIENLEIFSHKIDHDCSLMYYNDRGKDLKFTDHRTSIIHFDQNNLPKGGQPTNHIAEVIGDQEGIDQLLLSNCGIEIFEKNDIASFLKIIDKTVDQFLAFLPSLLIKLRVKETMAMFVILDEFYKHIAERSYANGEVGQGVKLTSLESKIDYLEQLIRHELAYGAAYRACKMNIQLYARLKDKEQKDEVLTESQKSFKTHTVKQIQICHVEMFTEKYLKIIRKIDETSSHEEQAFKRFMDKIHDDILHSKSEIKEHEQRLKTLTESFKEPGDLTISLEIQTLKNLLEVKIDILQKTKLALYDGFKQFFKNNFDSTLTKRCEERVPYCQIDFISIMDFYFQAFKKTRSIIENPTIPSRFFKAEAYDQHFEELLGQHALTVRNELSINNYKKTIGNKQYSLYKAYLKLLDTPNNESLQKQIESLKEELDDLNLKLTRKEAKFEENKLHFYKLAKDFLAMPESKLTTRAIKQTHSLFRSDVNKTLNIEFISEDHLKTAEIPIIKLKTP